MRLLLASFFLLLTMLPASAEENHPTFTDTEKASILSHGPWPPTLKPDPSNRFSGAPAAIAYGQQLFQEMRLSKGTLLSCASCHQPDRQFMDGVPLNRGHQMLDRHTPGLLNVSQQRWFGWDGANDNLWAQSLRPILTASEMNFTPADVKDLITGDPHLACGFKQAFNQSPAEMSKDALLVLLGKALAAYQETLITGVTAFDAFSAALAAEDATGIAQYPDAAARGLKLFVGEGRCNLCHFGPNFTNGEFGNIGIPYFIEKGKVDKGRFGGIQSLQANPYNLLGAYNDDVGGKTKLRTRHIKRQYSNWGEFKIPSLRNVADTAPYMHNGSLATLADVVDHYSELNEERLHADGEKILRPLNLSELEKADLMAFLKTLSAPLMANTTLDGFVDECRP